MKSCSDQIQIVRTKNYDGGANAAKPGEEDLDFDAFSFYLSQDIRRRMFCCPKASPQVIAVEDEASRHAPKSREALAHAQVKRRTRVSFELHPLLIMTVALNE